MKKYLLLIASFILTLQIKAQTISDVDGNTYNTVTIGTQVWMKENLKTTKYNDGTAIPNVTVNNDWINLTTAAYCWYENNAATYKSTYGALYNGYIINAKNVCPTGWHVPSKTEFDIFVSYLGGTDVAASKLRETGNSHWIVQPDALATNSSNFTGLPSGRRSKYDGTYFGVGLLNEFWLSTYYNTNYIYNFGTDNLNSLATGENYINKGKSIRCVQDSNSIVQITVTFNVDGGSAVPILTVTKNSAITKPTDPTKTGYTFAGWYKEAACTNAWNFATDVVTANITLFAKWSDATFVENKQVTDFKFYPNPAKDKLYINFNSPNISGAIYDLQGKRVIEIITGTNQIDISNLSKGIYIVKIIDSGKTMISKLIKE